MRECQAPTPRARHFQRERRCRRWIAAHAAGARKVSSTPRKSSKSGTQSAPADRALQTPKVEVLQASSSDAFRTTQSSDLPWKVGGTSGELRKKREEAGRNRRHYLRAPPSRQRSTWPRRASRSKDDRGK